MRAYIALLTCVLALAAAAFAPAASAVSVTCSASSITTLFWPLGHKQITSVGFPAFPTPHAEVYRSGAGYPNSNYLAFADAKGNFSPSKTNCTAAAAPNATPIANAKSTRKTKAIVCGGLQAITLTSTGANLRGQADGATLFKIALKKKKKPKKKRSKATYNSSRCRLARAPG